MKDENHTAILRGLHLHSYKITYVKYILGLSEMSKSVAQELHNLDEIVHSQAKWEITRRLGIADWDD